MLRLGSVRARERKVVGILMLFNRLLDTVVPPVGGPQKEIDRRFAAIVDQLESA